MSKKKILKIVYIFSARNVFHSNLFTGVCNNLSNNILVRTLHYCIQTSNSTLSNKWKLRKTVAKPIVTWSGWLTFSISDRLDRTLSIEPIAPSNCPSTVINGSQSHKGLPTKIRFQGRFQRRKSICQTRKYTAGP